MTPYAWLQKVEHELELAQQLLQKALSINPSSAEAHLRFGRITGLLDNHELAIEELKKGAELSTDSQLRYFAYLFLGNELSILKRSTEAHDYYEQAATLYPSAQSPLLGASHLARSLGDAESARKNIQRVFELSGTPAQPYDPWWDYDISHVRNGKDLAAEMQKLFGGLQ
jgi:tetratricopeptide (TPR) repeat protein